MSRFLNTSLSFFLRRGYQGWNSEEIHASGGLRGRGARPVVGGCVVTADQRRVRDYNQDGVFLFRAAISFAPGQLPGRRQLQAEDPAVMYNLGECYERLGNLPKASLCTANAYNGSPRTPPPAMPWAGSR